MKHYKKSFFKKALSLENASLLMIWWCQVIREGKELNHNMICRTPTTKQVITEKKVEAKAAQFPNIEVNATFVTLKESVFFLYAACRRSFSILWVVIASTNITLSHWPTACRRCFWFWFSLEDNKRMVLIDWINKVMFPV